VNSSDFTSSQAVGREVGGPPAPLYRRTLMDQIGPCSRGFQRGKTEYGRPLWFHWGLAYVWVNELCSHSRINYEEHLSVEVGTNPRKLADRAWLVRSICECAGKAGTTRAPENGCTFPRLSFSWNAPIGLAGERPISAQFDRLAQQAARPFMLIRISRSSGLALSLLELVVQDSLSFFVFNRHQIFRFFSRPFLKRVASQSPVWSSHSIPASLACS